MRKVLITAFITTFLVNYLGAQVTFKASANKVVELGENFRLNFTVNSNAESFNPPVIKNFNVLAGPSTSTSSSFQMINGKSSHTIANTYSYIIQANKIGKFTIERAEVTVKGKKYYSNPLTIEVIKGNASPNPNNSNNPEQGQLTTNDKSDIFVRINLNKTTVYQGEQLIASLKIYDRMGLKTLNDYKFPSYTGFWSQDIEQPQRITLNRENVNGKIYQTGIIRQSILFPQKSGKIRIDPFELECIVQQKAGKRRNFFGEMIDVYRDVTRKLKSASRTVNVLPLPANKPVSYSGAVGTNFKFDVNVDRTDLKSNESINLKVKISGNGNLKIIDKVTIDFPASFEVFDPKVNSSISNTKGGSKGSKTYDYLIIPREPGKYKIPPIHFSYFDVGSKSYKAFSSKEMNFNIGKGEGSQVITSNTGLSKEEVEAIGSDIRFIIQDDFELKKGDSSFFGSLRFYLYYLVSILLFFVFIFFLRSKIKQNQNLVLQKNRKANKISKKRLKEAANYMKQGNKEAFYDEVIRALWGYLSDKLNIPVAELSREVAIETLRKHKINDETIEDFVEVINNCEFAKYAPVSAHNQIEQDYDKARKTINKLVHVLS